MKTFLRQAKQDDIEYILKSAVAVWALEGTKNPSRESIEQERQRSALAVAEDRCAIAEEEQSGKCVAMIAWYCSSQRPFGGCAVSISSSSKPTFCWINVVCVNEERRGEGIGARMYEYVSQRVHPLPLYCDVYAVNESSLRFHFKLGFEIKYVLMKKNVDAKEEEKEDVKKKKKQKSSEDEVTIRIVEKALDKVDESLRVNRIRDVAFDECQNKLLRAFVAVDDDETQLAAIGFFTTDQTPYGLEYGAYFYEMKYIEFINGSCAFYQALLDKVECTGSPAALPLMTVVAYNDQELQENLHDFVPFVNILIKKIKK